MEVGEGGVTFLRGRTAGCHEALPSGLYLPGFPGFQHNSVIRVLQATSADSLPHPFIEAFRVDVVAF